MESRPLQDRLKLNRGESSSHSTYGEPAPLNLGRKIFLSHSGRDKEFVRFLQRELEDRYHYAIAFFDEESLPKSLPVSMENILKEARESKLGVLVLTEDFFMNTANPMLELEAFVASEVQLLPLFFTISVPEFKDKDRRARWEKRWREWSIVDEEVMNRWRHALDFVPIFFGLEYCQIATSHRNYIDRIVNEVTHIMPPMISSREEGVHGMDRLCKVVNNMYMECASSFNCTEDAFMSTSTSDGFGGERGNTLDVAVAVGIYGFGGLGKSTLCKYLCDFYFAEFNGKVCHVDLGSEPFEEAPSQKHCSSASLKRMKHVLFMLTNYKGVQDLNCSQVQHLLGKLISSGTNQVFLAIDNVLPDLDSKKEANFYLSCGPFPRGSKIFITSRSREILEAITSQCSVVIKHIPFLEFEDARNIFVDGMHDFRSPNLEDEVNQCHVKECVDMCTIWPEYGHPQCYHPFMIKSLAASIKLDRRQNLHWKRRLEELRLQGIADKNDAWESVFSMLDNTYKLLSEEKKTMFLDLALFCSGAKRDKNAIQWIRCVYSHLNNKRVDEILFYLHDLSFITMETRKLPFEVESRDLQIRVHDLIVDFSKYKVTQGGVFRSLFNLKPFKSLLI